MSSDDQSIETARAFFEALSDADWAALRSLVASPLVFGISNLSPDQLLDAFGDGEIERAAPVLAEHFEPGGEETGIEPFVAGHRAWREHHVEDYRLEHLSRQADDRVVYLARVTETHVGMYYGHPPTGEELTIAELGILRVVDGTIEAQRIAFDNNDFLVKMGLIPRDPYQAKVETQFYRVVNRVLRHNLRNDLSTISSYADLLGAGEETADYPRRIRATADDLLGTVTKMRTLERRVLAVTESEPVDLRAVVRDHVTDQRAAAPDAEVRMAVPAEPLTVETNEAFVGMALDECIENAVEHANAETPEVEVALAAAGTDEYAATITITDDGPGLPAAEIEPLARDTESALEHASGVGLWAIKWSIERLGGEVAFADNEPRGSVVRLFVPDARLEEAYMY